MVDSENGQSKAAYESGKRAAQIENLQKSLDEIKQALADHRKEEADTWERFERSLEDLKLWRAKMMGVAGIVAFIVTSAWHLFFNALKGAK